MMTSDFTSLLIVHVWFLAGYGPHHSWYAAGGVGVVHKDAVLWLGVLLLWLVC